jgi:mono/diheme cytochrome c family protein
MTRSGIIGGIFATLCVGGAAAAFAIAWRPAIAVIDPPKPQSFDANLVKRGRELAAIGNCADCHTLREGRSFAGGVPVPTPFGTIFSSNITPDPETGIGRWSEAAFRRAMRSGVDRDGGHLYPTFPYDHFTNVSDEDDTALYAFLMTREPVRASARENRLAFPLDHRVLVAGWKLLFLHRGAYRPDSTKSGEWNRGAYLVEGLAHCGACHTPRNFLGAEKSGRHFDGGEAEGWYAYALDAASPAPLPWTADTIGDYLRHGWQPKHGVALGPMAEVTHNLVAAPDTDVRAIATYVAGVLGTRHPPPASPPIPPPGSPGEALYRSACASCHEGSRGPPFGGIALGLSSALHAPNPTNLANVVVDGIPATGEDRAPIMPGFRPVLTNRQVSDLLTWLRARFGAPQPWDDIPLAVQAARDATALREATR